MCYNQCNAVLLECMGCKRCVNLPGLCLGSVQATRTIKKRACLQPILMRMQCSRDDFQMKS